MQNKRVVITGMGAISPLGNSAADMWENIKADVCGVRPIQSYDTSAQKVKLACEAYFDPLQHFPGAEVKKSERFILFARKAAQEAFLQSGLKSGTFDAERCGVMISSGIGGLSVITKEHSKGLERGFDRVSPFFIPLSIANMAGGQVAIDLNLLGYSCAVVTACAGGTNAIGDAMRLIRHGYLDAAVCGGTEACVTPLAIGGFTSMKALHEGDDPACASTPFDVRRSGFVLGEGAGVLVLEELTHALKRGANILAEVKGYGATSDAYHMTAPEPSGKSAARALKNAIDDAGLSPSDIDYINAHGTSTPLNDKIETLAVKQALGEAANRVKISSTKSMTGHLLGAAGAVEAIISVFSILEGFIPATINCIEPDPECDLDVVRIHGQKAEVKNAMSNSLGFGGHNAALILSRFNG